MARPKVDLPQPDSPTRPNVSPCSTVRLTPSTALTAPLLRENSACPTGKCFLRFRISNKLMGRPEEIKTETGRRIAIFLSLQPLSLCLLLRPLSPLRVRKMAGSGMSRLFFDELRFDLRAQISGSRTAIPETTTTRQMERIRHYPGDRVQALFL